MITAVIIDDEQNNIVNLQRLLEQYCPEVKVVGVAADANTGIATIASVNPDLVFLDIRMPGKDGFEMLRDIKEVFFEIVFVTAFDEYGIQAIKHAAMDYLLKPVDIGELKLAVEKSVVRMQQKKENRQLQYLQAILQQGFQQAEHRIALPGVKQTRFVFTRDIVRCESANSYTHFYMQDGEKITVSVPLIEYEDMLGGFGFIRCHQSHLINKRYVKSIGKDEGGYILMLNGDQVPLSRQKREYVKKQIV